MKYDCLIIDDEESLANNTCDYLICMMLKYMHVIVKKNMKNF